MEDEEAEKTGRREDGEKRRQGEGEARRVPVRFPFSLSLDLTRADSIGRAEELP